MSSLRSYVTNWKAKLNWLSASEKKTGQFFETFHHQNQFEFFFHWSTTNTLVNSCLGLFTSFWSFHSMRAGFLFEYKQKCAFYIINNVFPSTVKPEYNDHLRGPKTVVVVDRWLLFRGNFVWDLNIVVVIDRWSLFGGGR